MRTKCSTGGGGNNSFESQMMQEAKNIPQYKISLIQLASPSLSILVIPLHLPVPNTSLIANSAITHRSSHILIRFSRYMCTFQNLSLTHTDVKNN